MSERGETGAGAARADVERQLQETAARLEQSNRERRLFGDIVSHDLLNPVWVAENYLRIALEEPDPARARSFFEGARTALEKTRGILLDARTYLRLQEPRDFRREPLRLAPLVESAVKALEPLWEAKEQRVAIDVPADLEIEASPLLREVVANLVANAVRHAPPRTEVAVAARPGRPLRLEVRDRGPGVPADAREQIFQRFERIDKGAIQGVGLGLAICRRVVELHGGRIRVEDNPGGGACFVVEIPA